MHTYATKRNEEFKLHQLGVARAQNLFYKGSKVYDELPTNIKSDKSVKDSKSFCNTYVKSYIYTD